MHTRYINTIPVLLFIGIISFIIGLPTFLIGCNLNISSECFSYDVFDGYIYKYEIYQKTCFKCIHADIKGECESYQYYSCWDGYLYASEKNKLTQTDTSLSNLSIPSGSKCELKTASSIDSEYKVKKSMNSYNYGDKVRWYKYKGTSECKTDSYVISLWYIGILFLSFTCVVLVLSIGIYMYYLIEPYISRNYNEIIPNNILSHKTNYGSI